MKQTIRDIENLNGKKVLVRVDFNVPLKDGVISDDTRIKEALKTINFLTENGARVILCSHLGRPDGQVKKEFSLKPVAKRLAELVTAKVVFAKDTVGEDAVKKAEKLKNGQILLLENLRFDAREEENGADFAKSLADMAEVYVDDAFGTSHRKHASTYGVCEFLPAYAGFLMEKEIKMLRNAIDEPVRPFVAILGGAKIKDKLPVIEKLLDKADTIIIGGGMSNTFVKAMGGNVGNSIVDETKLDYAKKVLETAKEKNVQILLPVDEIDATEIKENVKTIKSKTGKTPEGYMALDIGKKTIKNFVKAIKKAGTVLWNGPLGVFEMKEFENGTKSVAEALAKTKAVTIVGGGDSVSAINKYNLASKISHVSTGGGASLTMLEGKEMPGIDIIKDKE